MDNRDTNSSQQHAYARRAAIGIGIPGFVATFVASILQRVRTIQDFFSLLTLVEAIILLVVGVGLCYLGGLILWRLKEKLETL